MDVDLLLHGRVYKGCDERVMVVWIYPYMSILALRCMGTSDVITFPAKQIFKEINIFNIFA